MALNWLRRSKLKPKSKDDSLNEQLEPLTLELTNLKRKVVKLVKKSEEYERTILKLRKESFELQIRNENITNENEILKRTVKTLEQHLRKLKKKNARSMQKANY